MSTSVTFNGTSYTVPAIADASWGTNVSNYLIAIASGCLQKTGGSFTLSQADVDFGATYGLKAVYFKSKTANIASAGVVQLAKTDVMSWRNNANSADLSLSINGSDALLFNGNPIVSLALGAAYTVLQMNSGGTAFSWATPTGTGAPVLQGSPTLTTPTLGVATATSINKMAITAPATSSTLAVADGKTATISNTLTFAGTDGKTVTFSNSLTFAGTDGNTMTFPSGSSTVMTLASADTITGVKSFNDAKLVMNGSSSGAMTLKAPAAASTYVATFFAATDTVMGLTFAQSPTNKTFDSTSTMTGVRIASFTPDGSHTLTFPGATDTVAVIATQQTFTNKIFSDSTAKFGNVSDTTKALVFSLGGATTGKTMTFLSSHTNDRTLTFPDATDTVALLAATQAFTNKDYQGGTASNSNRLTLPNASTSTLSGLTRKQATIVYDTTLNQVFSDDGTNLNPIGSGAGEKNYIATGSSNAGGWTASGAGITAATDTTAADLPRSITTKSGILLSRVSGSSAYAYYRFTLDPADYNKKLKIAFAQKPGGSYVASDFKVDMYSNTASDYSGTSTRLTLSTDSSAISALPNATLVFQTTFDASGSSAPYMELRVGLNAGTSGTTLAISDVIVGPGIQPQGAVIGPWISYTPTGSWNTNTTYAGRYRRVGTTMEIEITLSLAGAPNSATLNGVTMPTGFTIDTTAVAESSPAAATYIVGVGNVYDSNPGVDYDTMTYIDSISSGTFQPLYFTNSSGAGITQAAPVTFASGDRVHLRARVPINEWSTSGTVNVAQNDVEYAYNSATADSSDTTSFAYGPVGVAIGSYTAARAKRVRFLTPIQITDRIEIELQYNSATAPWLPLQYVNTTQGVDPLHYINTTQYGMGYSTVNATDIDVQFGTYGSSYGAATYGAAGQAWSANTANKWRVKKTSQGQAVGFATASDTVKGLVTSYAPTVNSGYKSVSSANYTATQTDGYETILFSTGNSDRTFTTPLVAVSVGRRFKIIKTDTGTGKVTPTAGDGSIVGPSNGHILFAQGAATEIVCDGTNWYVVTPAVNRSSTASTFTWDGSGGTSASKTLNYQRVGDWVTLQVPGVTATSGTSSKVLSANTALPTWARPATNEGGAITDFINNGADIGPAAAIFIVSSGVVSIQRDAIQTTVTNSASAGLGTDTTFTYYVGS